ncbi:Transforming growth factor beta-1-induced transcript 1 protein, partial [Linderina pennispora]
IGYCCVNCEGVLNVEETNVTPMPNRANAGEFESTQTLNEYFQPAHSAPTVCEACQEPLGDEYINIQGRRFHVMHFVCHDCRIPLYALGGYLQDPVGGEKFYCQRDYLQHFSPNCHACAIPITSGEMVVALGRTYHSECFVCSICQSPFVGDECYEHDGQPLCEWHWYIQNGRLCVECGAIIKEHCVMTRGKKYHQQCAEQKYGERAVSLEEAKRRVRAQRGNA